MNKQTKLYESILRLHCLIREDNGDSGIDVGKYNSLKILITKIVQETAQECYLECLAVECGHGECSEAIDSKYKLGNKQN